MHKPESIQENETHKILWNFGKEMVCLILTRRQDVVLISKKKENLQNPVVDFAVSVNH